MPSLLKELFQKASELPETAQEMRAKELLREIEWEQ
jgi:hypothetical protein